MVTGQPQVIYGNVRNTGLISNMPEGCCVEVPIVVERAGLRPCYVGALPPELAGYCASHTYDQDLTVKAALQGDPQRVHRAALLDRHASNVLTTHESGNSLTSLLQLTEKPCWLACGMPWIQASCTDPALRSHRLRWCRGVEPGGDDGIGECD
jgi:hypothetical protein